MMTYILMYLAGVFLGYIIWAPRTAFKRGIMNPFSRNLPKGNASNKSVEGNMK